MLNRTLYQTIEKVVVSLLAVFVLVLSGCVSEEKDDKAVGASASSSSLGPRVVYGTGFFGEERGADSAWRWMEPTGVIRLRNTGKEMELAITGRLPMEHYKSPPTMTIMLNGTKIDEYKGNIDVVSRTIAVTPAQQGDGDWSELKITSDMSFVPKEVNKASGDERRLAFQLSGLTWKLK